MKRMLMSARGAFEDASVMVMGANCVHFANAALGGFSKEHMYNGRIFEEQDQSVYLISDRC